MRGLTLGDPALVGRPAASGYNPLTEFTWHSAFWAEDPSWSNPGNGVAVSSWRNGGTLGTAATQATGANQPVFRSSVSALNNKPAIEFDTTNDDLTTGAFTSVAYQFSTVWIGNLGSTASNVNMFYLRSTNANPYTSAGVDGANKFRIYSGSNLASSVTANTSPLLVVCRFGSTANSARIDVGAASIIGSVSAGSADAVYFNSNAGAVGFGGGHRAFFGLISGDIFAHANYAALRTWASSHYGVTV